MSQRSISMLLHIPLYHERIKTQETQSLWNKITEEIGSKETVNRTRRRINNPYPSNTYYSHQECCVLNSEKDNYSRHRRIDPEHHSNPVYVSLRRKWHNSFMNASNVKY